MPDWQDVEVEPDSVVAVDGVPAGTTGAVLSLPLVSPMIGQFEVRLKARRPLRADAKSLSLTLPQPQASAPTGTMYSWSSVVAVLPADNVEIIPDSQATTGLMRQQAAVPLELPKRQQEPLFYRSDAPKAVFAAELRRHRQKITAGVSSRVTPPASGYPATAIRVDQKFAYSIAYEPTDYFLLEVPRELVAKGRLVLNYEDQVLVPVVLNEEADDGVKPLRMRVALPKACIGPCEITARYAVPSSAAAGYPLAGGTRSVPATLADAGNIHVPLIMPLGVELAANNVLITPLSEQQLEVVTGVWTAVESGLNQAGAPADHGYMVPGSRTREVAAGQRTAEIVLKPHDETGDAAVVVERALILTRLTRSARDHGSMAPARQDFVVLQFTTRRRELEITLPEGAACEQASVQLNEKSVAPRSRDERVLVIPLSAGIVPADVVPADVEPPRYVLCLQYHFPVAWPEHRLAGAGAMQFEFPSLGDDAWIRRAYWQLLLPPEEHLVGSPPEWTGEFAWSWNRFYFGRRPVLGQTDLEAWAGLRHPGSVPAPAGMNVYLFSSLGRIGPSEIVTAGRSTIVFISSGIALLLGLLLIYVPAARHPVALLVGAAFLAGLTAIYPELALMAAQASAVGLALALLALFLRQLTATRERAVGHLQADHDHGYMVPDMVPARPPLAEVPGVVAPVPPAPQPGEPPVPAAGSSTATIIPTPPDAVT